MQKNIAVIDYGMGNIFSVKNAADKLGFSCELLRDSSLLSDFDGAVLPGVGAFGEAMNSLKQTGFENEIIGFVESGKPLMGICLGLQLLFSESFEFQSSQGLGVFSGCVRNLSEKVSAVVPHVGWNQVTVRPPGRAENSPVLEVPDGEFMYFVHSFYVEPEDDSVVCTESDYDDFRFCSSVLKENVFASQFHPEKGGEVGLGIMKKFFTDNFKG